MISERHVKEHSRQDNYFLSVNETPTVLAEATRAIGTRPLQLYIFPMRVNTINGYSSTRTRPVTTSKEVVVIVHATQTTTFEQSRLDIITNSKQKLTTHEKETRVPFNIANIKEVVVADPSTPATSK